MNPRPNILLFLMDGLQASALEPGSACITPTFDKFRAGGLAFNRAYTTTPTCSPARASLMTGLLPHNHGVLEVEHGRDADVDVNALAARGLRLRYEAELVEDLSYHERRLAGALERGALARVQVEDDEVRLVEVACPRLPGVQFD